MADPDETIQRLESGLKPFAKPREQVNYIRRVLALHLGAEAQSVPVKHPLSLTGTAPTPNPGSTVKGIHKDYLDLLRAHAEAKLEFDAAAQAVDSLSGASPSPSTSARSLEEQVDLLSLRKKYERLSTVQEHLDALAQKPACSQDFLDANQTFQGSVPLPRIPDAIVSSFFTEQNDSASDLKGRVRQLEKTALRAKMLLKQQEQLLQNAKARAKRQASTVSHAERLNALNATRNELINWMELELSNASTDDVEEAPGGARKGQDSTANLSNVKPKLVNIQEKYTKYVEARRSILGVASQRMESSIQLAVPPPEVTSRWEPKEAPGDYLLTPYIDNLLRIAQDLKTDIGHKSYMTSTLKQRSKDTEQTLQHLAGESQLLPAHSTQARGRTKELINSNAALGLSDNCNLPSQIQSWVTAADSAKITTLESVAETVEAGQVALESFMKSLEAIRQLLGLENPEHDTGTAGAAEDDEDDLWLNNGGQVAAKRKPVERPQTDLVNDIWSKLRGNLGLIGHDELS